MLYDQPVINREKLTKKKGEDKKNTPPEPLQDVTTEEEIKKATKVKGEEERRLIEEGRREGLKELAKHEIEVLPKTQELERTQDRELMRIKTIFPFVFFPDEFVVEENKLTFIWRTFFWSKDVRSILLKDISNISVSTGYLFAAINVVDRYFAHDNMAIHYLPKKKALEARRLVQGLIVSVRDNIDYSDVPKHEIIKHAMKLGEADTKT